MTLLERITQSDLIEKPDWEVADILSSPDESLPEIVSPNPTEAGIGTIMIIFGVSEGTRVLEEITSLASSNSSMKWILKIIESGKVDFSSSLVRDQIQALQNLQIISATQAQDAISYGETRRYPSWAEHYGIHVDSRSVGLARGGV